MPPQAEGDERKTARLPPQVGDTSIFMLVGIPGVWGLPCVSEAGGDAIDCGGEGVVKRLVFLTGAFSAKKLDLNQAHGIHVWVAPADGACQNWICFLQQL